MARKPNESDKLRTTKAERIDVDEIAAMPALLDTVQAARIVGATPLYISKMCAQGVYQAVKCGREWRINKAKFLQAVGLA